MKKKTVGFIMLLLVGTVMLYVWQAHRGVHSHPPEPGSFPAVIGGEENPQARWQWEWQRLRDPNSGKIPPGIRARELAYAATLPVAPSSSSLYKRRSSGETDWISRGPVNVGGRTRALAIDVTDENVILAGGVSGGMWRSDDGGATWIKTTDPSQLHSVTAIVQDTRPGKTNTWYYSTGELVGNSASAGSDGFFVGDGIFKSDDGGNSWTPLPATVSGTPQFDALFDIVWNLALDLSNLSQDEIYAATYNSIQRSVDGGNSWEIRLGGFSSPFSTRTDVAVSANGIVYATLSSEGNDRGIWRSSDGIFWSRITPPGFPSTYGRIVIGISPVDENDVYFLAETPGSGLNDHSLWHYQSGSWQNLSGNLPAYGPPVGNYESQHSYDMLIKLKPDAPNVIFIGGTNLYRSTDGFATRNHLAWIGGYAPVNDVSRYPGQHPDQHALVFLPSNPRVMFAGHDGGISKTLDNTAATVVWDTLNNGYLTSQFYTLAIDKATEGSQWVVGGMQDNGTWGVNDETGSVPWQEFLTGDGSFSAISNGADFFYLSIQSGPAFRFSRDMSQWTRIDPAGGSGYLFVNPFVLDPNNNNRIYLAGGDRIWRNSDVSQIPLFSEDPATVNWKQITTTQIFDGKISALGITKTPANRLYYGTTRGRIYRLDNSHTANPIPIEITGPNFPADAYLNCIAVNPENGDELVVVFSNYNVVSLFRSGDGGSSWSNISGNLEQNPDGSGDGPSTRWAAIMPVQGRQYYFVGSSTGLYSTTALNGALTIWKQESPDLIGNVVVDMVAVRPVDGLVAVATHGNGVYSRHFPTRPGDGGPPIAESFVLQQNYPNPFNNITRIPFTLNTESQVILQIFNSRGQQVRTLVNQTLTADTYTLTWDGTDHSGHRVASGVYVYRLTVDNQHEEKRMVLVK